MEKALFILVTILFVFVPLYPKIPLANVANTFVAVRIEDVLIAITIILWLAYMIKTGQTKTFFKDRLNQSLLIFFFIGALSIFSANFLTHSVIPNLSLLHWARRVELMILMPVVATVIKTRKQLIFIMIMMSFVLLAVNIYSIGQQYLDWPVISTSNSEFSKGLILSLTPGARVNSTFAGHYDLAVFLATALILISALFFVVKHIFKIWLAALGLFSLLVLIMTAARISFVAAIAGIFATLFLLKKWRFIILMLICSSLILVYPSQLRDRFISTITVNIFSQGQRYLGKTDDQRLRNNLNIPTLAIQTSSLSASTSTFGSSSGELPTDITPGEPIDTTQLGVYRSFEIRTNIEWPRAIKAFEKNPFLGTGYSSIDIATDNDLLRSLGEVGLLGTISFILIFIEVGKRTYKNFKNRDKFIKYFSAATYSIILAFIINGTFIDVFEASKVASIFWMILGLNLSIKNFTQI